MVEFNGRTSYFERAKNDRENYDRRAFYASVTFYLKRLQTDLNIKIDTGASRTVIGLNNPQFNQKVKHIILQEPICDGRLESATLVLISIILLWL